MLIFSPDSFPELRRATAIRYAIALLIALLPVALGSSRAAGLSMCGLSVAWALYTFWWSRHHARYLAAAPPAAAPPAAAPPAAAPPAAAPPVDVGSDIQVFHYEALARSAQHLAAVAEELQQALTESGRRRSA